MKKLLLFTLLTVFLFSCEAQKEISDNQPPAEESAKKSAGELEGKWVAEFISPYGGADINHFTIQKPYLTFVSSFEVAGNNGCNNIAGTYEVDGNTIKFDTDKFRSTKMFCQGVNEEAVPKLLKMVNRYEVVNGKTLMLSAGDAVVMTLIKVED